MMGETSGGGFNPEGKAWQAEYWFRGQPGVPGVTSGGLDVHGFAAVHCFERLAAHLISEAARRWWTLDVPPAMADFGNLLRYAKQVAEAHGRWTYEPNGRQEWADVTVTYAPVGRIEPA
ncbi:hypothetical protein ACIOGZ_41805 [Kitasatospora sp. NPDC088160]|uniref:hypothetical protein n=1 Tax=Kitasatospora sp. NPDC088160 TaxID=3364072 RepID=UPI0038104DAF